MRVTQGFSGGGRPHKQLGLGCNIFFNNFEKKPKKSAQKAFSIAEAMITLLIVSLALAAAAPIMSRSMKNSNNSYAIIARLEQRISELEKEIVPIGSVMYFDDDACPNDHWKPITDNSVFGADANGAFLRNMGEDTALTGETATRTRGSLQRAAVQNIRAQFSGIGQAHGGAGTTAATLRGAVYRVNGDDQPTEGVKVANDGDLKKDDFFGFDASAYDSSTDIAVQNHGAKKVSGFTKAEGHTTVYNDRVKEVRPDNIALLACKKVE